jgi:4a-hydroxytetrahydrobiopterin dehydratase
MDLSKKKCVPCRGGVPPLPTEKAQELLKELNIAWKLADNKIERTYKFRNFREAMVFINKVASIAEAEGHHPDIHLEGWNSVRIVLYTHAIGGLHENDFIVAAKIDGLV